MIWCLLKIKLSYLKEGFGSVALNGAERLSYFWKNPYICWFGRTRGRAKQNKKRYEEDSTIGRLRLILGYGILQ